MRGLNLSDKAIKRLLTITAFIFMLAAFIPSVAQAAPPDHAGNPDKEEFFICPSVSTNNEHGMWVMGAHGAYYVLIPTKGGVNENSVVFLTVPVSVPDKAQIPAGWALYKDVETYPNFEGMIVLLGEGIDTWLGSPAGWNEFDMAKVMNNGDGTYTVMNMTVGESVTISQPVPLASAAVW